MNLNRTPRGDPIYILDERTSSIAGIRINSLNQRITDPRVRADVQKALERLTLHVAYTKERGCNWENSKSKRRCFLCNVLRGEIANTIFVHSIFPNRDEGKRKVK